jgi:alkylation response protein AidB-like acyl-CoA dehydrogenase
MVLPFGGKIIDFQGIQWYFAEAAAEIDAARLICCQAARDLDSGGDFQRSSSAAKLLSAALATKVAGMAVQVCARTAPRKRRRSAATSATPKPTKSPAGQPRS